MIVFDVLKFYCVASPTEVERAWWLSRTSNPVRRVNSLAGGFDSHALPPFFPAFFIRSCVAAILKR